MEDWQSNPTYKYMAGKLARTIQQRPSTIQEMDYLTGKIASEDMKSRINYVRDLAEKEVREKNLANTERKINLEQSNAGASNKIAESRLKEAKSSLAPELLLGGATALFDIKSGIEKNKRDLLMAKRYQDMASKYVLPSQTDALIYGANGQV